MNDIIKDILPKIKEDEGDCKIENFDSDEDFISSTIFTDDKLFGYLPIKEK